MIFLLKGYLNLSIQVYQCSFWYNVNRFFLQTIPLMVASNFTGVASHLGVYRNGNISLSFRVTCKQNFSGPSCFANSTSLNSNMSTMNSYLNGGTCMVSQSVHIWHAHLPHSLSCMHHNFPLQINDFNLYCNSGYNNESPAQMMYTRMQALKV